AACSPHAAGGVDGEVVARRARLRAAIDVDIAGGRLAVVHGGVALISRFLFASTAAVIKAEELEISGADGILAGHCGLPFTQTIRGKLWHNAGAIGMPANDGTPRVWFSVLTPHPGGLRVEH